MITLDDIHQAQSRFEGRVATTPLLLSDSFSRISGREVYLKAECMQRAGSFKIRGALNVVSRLDGQPVVAASAGNHAQGVALASAFSGSPCTVYMPENAPIPKVKATHDYGATVVLEGASLADAVEAAREFADEEGARFVHPYDDPLIIAGQATMGLELMEQLPDVGTVVIPTGGGGLLAGSSYAIHTVDPKVDVIGVEIDVASVYAESRKRNELIRDFPRGRPTVADGINVSVPSDLVWEICHDHVSQFLVVDDDQATNALTMVLERSKLLVEAAGAVGIAALLEKMIPDDAPDPICIVLSGGNIDLLFLGKAVKHGLETSGRFARFEVLVPDQPGSLARVLEIIASEGGNVVQVDHHREGWNVPFGKVEIEISVETRDADHASRLREALTDYLG
jgi:threonine dehydratase